MNKEIKEVAEKHDLSVEDFEEILVLFFDSLRKHLTSAKMPRILINEFGVFKPSLRKIKWRIRCNLDFYRRKVWDREKTIEKINYLWPIRERLIAEKNGKNVYRCWRDLPEDKQGYRKCHGNRKKKEQEQDKTDTTGA